MPERTYRPVRAYLTVACLAMVGFDLSGHLHKAGLTFLPNTGMFAYGTPSYEVAWSTYWGVVFVLLAALLLLTLADGR